MEGNKDEALKCIGIAKEAIAAGNKERALKFIKISQRLNSDLSVDDLLVALQKMDKSSSENGNHNYQSQSKATAGAEKSVNKQKNYTEEHVKLIRQVNQNKDYYAILGVEKSCSVEDIKKGYRKLSLKVHPDKNKAPGAEEAFKKVSKAFKCLSEEESRRQYDQTGHVEDYEDSQQHVRRRRSTTTTDFYGDEFDPNEIFRAFFGQTNGFSSSHVFRTGGMGTQQRTTEANGGRPNYMVLLQLIPFLFILLLTSLPSSEPEYSLQKTYNYQIPRMTEKYGIGYFVKSPDFDRSYPPGSEARARLEGNLIHDYKNALKRNCHIEYQRRQWNRNLPTPNCDRLKSFGLT